MFRDVNNKLAVRVSTIPTAHEPTLDMAFIDALNGKAYPASVPGGWTLTLDTHFLGGLRLWRHWKIADIGVLFMFRKDGKLVGSKAALLQSKRLYPQEQSLDEDELEDYAIGFARLYKDSFGTAALRPRTFTLTKRSSYRALCVDDNQYKAIEEYETATKVPVFYCLYNPWMLPWTVTLPVVGVPKKPKTKEVGTRILPASRMRSALSSKPSGYSPTYDDLLTNAPPEFQGKHAAGWRLEHFMVDRLLACKDGHRNPSMSIDSGLERMFYRRSGPISAAIAITIDAGKADVRRD
ncbi:MAG: hypothetical protein JO257_07495 [Deltaproteobacteria bacterium]|nr:hypothetical protein [Deltaproteobacteria bacterium]